MSPAGQLNREVSHQSLISAVSLRLMSGRDIANSKSPLTRSSAGITQYKNTHNAVYLSQAATDEFWDGFSRLRDLSPSVFLFAVTHPTPLSYSLSHLR